MVTKCSRQNGHICSQDRFSQSLSPFCLFHDRKKLSSLHFFSIETVQRPHAVNCPLISLLQTNTLFIDQHSLEQNQIPFFPKEVVEVIDG